MADVFLSYRNTPLRRMYVERLRLALDAFGLSAWWDYGLEAGREFEPQIIAELESASVIVPLWCAESVNSVWVIKEAQYAFQRGKMLPVKLQDVSPPPQFSAIQAQDLVQWHGDVQGFQVLALADIISQRLGQLLRPTPDKFRALRSLPLLPSLDETLLTQTTGTFGLSLSELSAFPRFSEIYAKAKKAQQAAREVHHEVNRVVTKARLAATGGLPNSKQLRWESGTSYAGQCVGDTFFSNAKPHGYGIYAEALGEAGHVTYLGQFENGHPTVAKMILGTPEQENQDEVAKVYSRFDALPRPEGPCVFDVSITRFEGESSMGFPCGYTTLYVENGLALMVGETDCGKFYQTGFPDGVNPFLVIWPSGFLLLSPDDRVLGIYARRGDDMLTLYAANEEYDFHRSPEWDFAEAGADLRRPATGSRSAG